MTSIGVPALTPVRAAATVDELVAHARRTAPTVVLLDAHIAAPGPHEAIRRLRTVAPAAAVVLLASPDDTVALDRALALGARGFLAPDVGRPELSAVAAHILASPVAGAQRPDQPVDVPRPSVPAPAVPPGLPNPSLPASVQPEPVVPPQRSGDADGAESAEPPRPALTKREIEVLVGMSNGRSNAQIGAELFLSEDTVKTHARRLFRKLGAADRAQAVAIGLRGGLIR
ncbi:DNA-binding response regulator [Cellulomonas massiliensis]|uniref:DNA-binding response regulator n=1 Tax=Cellulomonas massiliensis TaxID=1465811 RepID=UPI003CCC6ED3